MLKRQDKKGFTLIELLVVISIIALLLSILMPALSKVKEQARTIICGSRMKDIGLSLLMYVNDYNNRFPIAYDNNLAVDSYGTYSNPDIPNLNSDPASYWTTNLIATEYITNRDILFCPSEKPNNYQYVLDENPMGWWLCTYGLREWDKTSGQLGHKITKIRQSTDFFLITDSYNPEQKTQAFRIWSPIAGLNATCRDYVYPRHNDRASTLFADGHVERKEGQYFLNLKDTQTLYGSDYGVWPDEQNQWYEGP